MAVERVGVSFEPELLEQFDKLIKKKGYTNRSEALRDLARDSIVQADIQLPQGLVVGTMTIVYNHEDGDITNKLLHYQHGHHDLILSTTHIHIDGHDCLEVLVVKGRAEQVRALSDNIRALKGIKHGKLVLVTSSPP